MGYDKTSLNYGNLEVQSTNISAQSYQQAAQTSEALNPVSNDETLDLSSILSPNSISSQQIDPTQEALNKLRQEMAGKTVASVRQASPDEAILYKEITIYTDGTEVDTGINQNVYQGCQEYIKIPITPDGKEQRIVMTFEGNNEGLVMIENKWIDQSYVDPNFGKVDAGVSTNVIKHYANREDGLVTKYVNMDNVEYTTREEYSGRSDGIVALEDYPDKIVVYIEQGGKTIQQIQNKF